MNIYCIPSSGGRFACQLGLLSEVCGILDKPCTILATSGGNLSSYILLASDYSANGILRVCNYISSKLFSMTWWPKNLNFLPSFIIGFTRGSIYKAGSG